MARRKPRQVSFLHLHHLSAVLCLGRDLARFGITTEDHGRGLLLHVQIQDRVLPEEEFEARSAIVRLCAQAAGLSEAPGSIHLRA
jgi:hypothetical protein